MVRMIQIALVALVAQAAFAAQYKVRSGDTLESIARRKGVSIDALAKANGIRDPNDIVVGRMLAIPSKPTAVSRAPAAPAPSTATTAVPSRRYVVKDGDTLGIIASRYGVGTLDLAKANRLEDPDDLRNGQVLVIPGRAAADRPSSVVRMSPLPAATKAALDRIRVVPGKWRYIVVHHSGSVQGTVRGMDAYHRYVRHMENGLAYHFVIGNGRGMGDGEIAICSRWRGQLNGGHLASESLNAKSIGICLVGNFDFSRPDDRQMRSLFAVISYLRNRCGLPASAVKLHRQINTRPTECPGNLFPARTLFDNL